MQLSNQHTSFAEVLERKTCKKTFTQKSSLVRHLKCCGTKRTISDRKKSCRNCSVARSRCDLRRPCCSRCASRGDDCKYLTPTQRDCSPANVPTRTLTAHVHYVPVNTIPQKFPPNHQTNPSFGIDNQISTHDVSQNLDFSRAILDAEHTGDRTSSHGVDSPATSANTLDLQSPNNHWMIPFLPQSSISDTTPLLAKNSMQILLRLFRIWPRMTVKGFQLPPMFHPSMNTLENPLPQPLSNCFTIARMWDGQCEGASAMVQETVLRETKTIFANLQSYDETDLVAALQALMIYTILLVFPSHDQNTIPSVDPSIFIGIQQVVYYTAGTGVILQEETDHITPSWDAWIHVSSKRRVIFSLYLLHWAYSVYHRLPSFNCDELGFMPAPAAKFLWQAGSKQEWERLYKRWLVQWDGREYLQRELTYIKSGLNLDRRTQLWLEDTDELGVLMLSIFNATDREPEFMLHTYKA